MVSWRGLTTPKVPLFFLSQGWNVWNTALKIFIAAVYSIQNPPCAQKKTKRGLRIQNPQAAEAIMAAKYHTESHDNYNDQALGLNHRTLDFCFDIFEGNLSRKTAIFYICASKNLANL